jgi:putative membrane protein
MIKNILGGLIFGIANIIPGISGGTVLVFLGLFNRTIESLSNIFKIEPIKKKSKDINFILQLAMGFFIGIISFAKIIEKLFYYYPVQTMYWFIGLIVFSIPIILKNELKGIKFSKYHFIIGAVIIGSIVIFNPEKTGLIIKEFPLISIQHLISMTILGLLIGMITIVPGISGAMVMLIIGQYYLFQSYIANVTTLQINIILPIAVFGIGSLIGLIIGAKTINYFLVNYRANTISLILGLVMMSSIVLIPINISYDFNIILTSLASFLFGGLIVIIFELLKSKKD